MTIVLDGNSLTIEQLARIARDPSVRVECDPATHERVARGEALITSVVENYRRAYEESDDSGQAPVSGAVRSFRLARRGSYRRAPDRSSC